LTNSKPVTPYQGFNYQFMPFSTVSAEQVHPNIMYVGAINRFRWRILSVMLHKKTSTALIGSSVLI